MLDPICHRAWCFEEDKIRRKPADAQIRRVPLLLVLAKRAYSCLVPQ
jgi:hypothetical protein